MISSQIMAYQTQEDIYLSIHIIVMIIFQVLSMLFEYQKSRMIVSFFYRYSQSKISGKSLNSDCQYAFRMNRRECNRTYPSLLRLWEKFHKNVPLFAASLCPPITTTESLNIFSRTLVMKAFIKTFTYIACSVESGQQQTSVYLKA